MFQPAKSGRRRAPVSTTSMPSRAVVQPASAVLSGRRAARTGAPRVPAGAPVGRTGAPAGGTAGPDPRRRPSKLRAAALSAGVLTAGAGLALTAVFPGQGQAQTADVEGLTAQDIVAAEVTAPAEAEVDFGRQAPQASAGEASESSSRVLSNGIEEAAADDDFAVPLEEAAIASPFGYRVNPLGGFGTELHTGTDYAGACGTPVLAARSGSVIESGWHAYGGGQRIVVDHGDGLKTSYNHLGVLGVSVGATVEKGQGIGGVGSTGNSTGCHLHFELMVNDEKVDPQAWL